MAKRTNKGPAVKKAAEPWVPTLAEILATIAGHVQTISTHRPTRTDAPYSERARVGMGVGGFTGTDAPSALVYWTIRPATGTLADEGGEWGVWAQCFARASSDEDEGAIACGNRHGAVQHYVALCAPVVAWVAAYWAAKQTAALEAPSAAAVAS